MAENSAIEWTHHTFNPWWGCQKVSPACDHCYAERDAKRFDPGRVLWGVGSERRTFADKHWKAPTEWNAKARESREQLGNLHERPRVFCASMGDWLDLDAPLDEFVRLLDLIRLTPELDWLLLSKRIGNWRKRMQEARDWIGTPERAPEFFGLEQWLREWIHDNPPANVWIGATIVNQEEFDRDVAKLDAVPARTRFLSMEPLLGPVELHWEWLCGTGSYNGIDWVIVGGESGPKARPMHPDWARSIRDQCRAAGVPFLFKQWGEWKPISEMSEDETNALYRSRRIAEKHERQEAIDEIEGRVCRVEVDGVGFQGARGLNAFRVTDGKAGMQVFKIGKKAAGRLLDGVQHDGYPK